MTPPTRRTIDPNIVRTVILLTVALVALAVLGALIVQRNYMLRGIPDDFPQPIAHAGPRLGVNVDLAQYDDSELAGVLADIEAAGFGVVKQTFHFSAENAFDWSQTDRLIDAVADSGVALVPLLDGDPANGFAPPTDSADFAAWAAEFAARYGDVVDYYIVWDEPNLAAHWGGQAVNPDDYAALLSATAAAIRSADATAFIVAAPLAPTTETDTLNLADPLYLQALYEADAAPAFDIAAAKPYGFDTAPDDRTVDIDTLNFSRAVLLREVMEHNGDAVTALWAGNWGWNALPPGWAGQPSIWGAVDLDTQQTWTRDAWQRAVAEWPWMGVMFLENWEPNAPPDDARWGFSVAGLPLLDTVQTVQLSSTVAYPGFHLATDADSAQSYEGDWRFSAEFGADSSEKTGDQPRDSVQIRFWGTDLGLRVRRADFRARFYVTVDGEPANALPHDENGAMLVLDAPDPAEDYVTIEPVATGLAAGEHVAVIVAERGWGQWALNGFSVAYRPEADMLQWGAFLLGGLALFCGVFAVRAARRADWGAAGGRAHVAFARLGQRGQLALIGVIASIAALTGWLTWGQQAAGAYRRLSDGSQVAVILATATVFYITPVFFVYVAALVVLIILLSFRPSWGLALIALTMPFYAYDWLKPVFSYRFSPVEVFTWATLAGFVLAQLTALILRHRDVGQQSPRNRHGKRLISADYAVLTFTLIATASLFFTQRLDPALREWRVIIVNAALIYALLRWIRPSRREMWVVLDAWVLGAVIVAVVGLGEYVVGSDRITAEGGLFRLRSVYGSPNNVALYFGRIVPFLCAILLWGKSAERRRRLYALALVPIGVAFLLTFSKGGLLLAVPVGVLIVFVYWQRANQRRVWPWLLAFAIVGAVGFLILLRVPPLAARLDLFGETTVLRLYLWRASVNMFADNFWTGVGLDNFLTAYRGQYIFADAWREPNLNHPHNILLDFGTRLGIFGLLAGIWLIAALGWNLLKLPNRLTAEWQPVAVGLLGGLGAMLAHGMVDHAFFLIDLAAVFYLMLGIAVWMNANALADGDLS